MKKLSKKWIIRGSAMTLAALCLGTGAALAASGDSNDPLVTLSYLNQTAIPQVVEQVEQKTAVRQEELKNTFNAQISQYLQGGQGSSAGYTLVTLSAGQVMHMEVGCEVLLRIGSASVQASDSPALIDVSAGGTVNSGTSLTKNHLYMATISGRTIVPTSGTVKVLVRGGYTVS